MRMVGRFFVMPALMVLLRCGDARRAHGAPPIACGARLLSSIGVASFVGLSVGQGFVAAETLATPTSAQRSQRHIDVMNCFDF
jgi:hypothetical protein